MRKEKGFTPLEIRIANRQSGRFLTGPVRGNFSKGAGFTPLGKRITNRQGEDFLTGFTLIELLVVIAVIALLMAILVPTLQRVRRQAKAVVCLSNLREWGIIWSMYTDDNGGYFPGGLRAEHAGTESVRAPWTWWCSNGSEYWDTGGMPGIRCCPMAAKPVRESGYDYKGAVGGTFLAWGGLKDERGTYGSYGINAWVYQPYYRDDEFYSYYWRTPRVEGASNIPVQLDNYGPYGYCYDIDGPPECDAVPIPPYRVGPDFRRSFCINRHDGGINGLFMDWSVRKIGLKELWTLKWHREFDTAGPWTRAGGVAPEDWPEWMRKFKDY